MSDEAKTSRGLLGRLRGAISERRKEATPERRSSKRVSLPIPVRLKVGTGETGTGRLHDVSQQAFCVEAASGGAPGDRAAVRFEGYAEVCDPFILAGEVARVTEEDPRQLVIEIDRAQTPPEALAQYRALVLHYLRHKPLLDEVSKGYFEGRCKSCSWVGRVGSKAATCPSCGEAVVPVTT